MSILDNITKTHNRTIDVKILTDEELKKCTSVSDAIRKCHQKDPKLSNGTIAKFLSQHRTKPIRPQHVYNVLHTELKRK
jgi:hypothetical protein